MRLVRASISRFDLPKIRWRSQAEVKNMVGEKAREVMRVIPTAMRHFHHSMDPATSYQNADEALHEGSILILIFSRFKVSTTREYVFRLRDYSIQ
jgi:hypothetical protein